MLNVNVQVDFLFICLFGIVAIILIMWHKKKNILCGSCHDDGNRFLFDAQCLELAVELRCNVMKFHNTKDFLENSKIASSQVNVLCK